MNRLKPSRVWVGLSSCLVAIVIAAHTNATAQDQRMPGSASRTWDIQADTWVATDALGRTLPTGAEVGPPRAHRTVGIFYFLWLGRHGERGPLDISKILARDPTAITNPESPLWGPLGVPHHWGESLFGYYVSDDESVLRKHAQMLADAGVDMLVFDVTNQVTYKRSWQALCRVFDQMRRAGNRVPKIAFLCPFWAPRNVVRELWDQLYSRELYPQLWFRWEGKPLILADPDLLGQTLVVNQEGVPVELVAGHTLGQTITVDRPFDGVGGRLPNWAKKNSTASIALYRAAAEGPAGTRLADRKLARVVDNGWLMLALDRSQPPGRYYIEISEPAGKVGWWSSVEDNFANGQAFADRRPVTGDRAIRIRFTDEKDQAIRHFFTFRKPQPDYFTGPTGPGQWGWLEVYPQHAFYKTPGVAEQVAVGVAQNAVDGKLSVLSNPRSHGRSFHDGKEPAPAGQDETGRNFTEQWQRALKIDPPFVFITGWNEWIAGRFDKNAPFYGSGPVTFVDEFNQEYSRDIEPMKGGHGDNYYYQMVDYIRRYKGVRRIPAVQSSPISIDGNFHDWSAVSPEYRDTIGDPVRRNYRGWGPKQHYENHTGRNDIVAAKVSIDARHVYFYVRCAQPRVPAGDLAGTLLFLDVDSDPKTGWLGYDVVVNHQAGPHDTAVIEHNVEGRFAWNAPTPIHFRTVGTELELAVPRAELGLRSLPATLDFKWADNIKQTGHWSDFTRNGDVAPNDRFNYRAVFK